MTGCQAPSEMEDGSFVSCMLPEGHEDLHEYKNPKDPFSSGFAWSDEDSLHDSNCLIDWANDGAHHYPNAGTCTCGKSEATA